MANKKEDPTPRFGPNEPPYRSPAKGVLFCSSYWILLKKVVNKLYFE